MRNTKCEIEVLALSVGMAKKSLLACKREDLSPVTRQNAKMSGESCNLVVGKTFLLARPGTKALQLDHYEANIIHVALHSAHPFPMLSYDIHLATMRIMNPTPESQRWRGALPTAHIIDEAHGGVPDDEWRARQVRRGRQSAASSSNDVPCEESQAVRAHCRIFETDDHALFSKCSRCLPVGWPCELSQAKGSRDTAVCM